nr:leucine--tRNA ligase, cytoplasmic [Tanacetum cinerariifolium]
KVSKSIRNFRTLKQAIDDFSTDATRFSLADAGDDEGIIHRTALAVHVPGLTFHDHGFVEVPFRVQAFDLKLPFGEIEAGRYASLLKQSPPSLGSPTSIFLTKEDHVYKVIDALPIIAHSTTQFTTGVIVLQ